ncbi:hypothetical protein [Persephonella sp.]
MKTSINNLKEKLLENYYWGDEEKRLLAHLDLDNYDWLTVRMIASDLGLIIDHIYFDTRLRESIEDIKKRNKEYLISQIEQFLKEEIRTLRETKLDIKAVKEERKDNKELIETLETLYDEVESIFYYVRNELLRKLEETDDVHTVEDVYEEFFEIEQPEFEEKIEEINYILRKYQCYQGVNNRKGGSYGIFGNVYGNCLCI